MKVLVEEALEGSLILEPQEHHNGIGYFRPGERIESPPGLLDDNTSVTTKKQGPEVMQKIFTIRKGTQRKLWNVEMEVMYISWAGVNILFGFQMYEHYISKNFDIGHWSINDGQDGNCFIGYGWRSKGDSLYTFHRYFWLWNGYEIGCLGVVPKSLNGLELWHFQVWHAGRKQLNQCLKPIQGDGREPICTW